MRKLIMLAGAVALAACSQEPAEDTATTEAPVEEAAPAGAVANGSPAGVYEVTNADGSKMTANINADGTYSDVAADGTVAEEGTYAVVDGKTCFTPTTEGAKPMCFTESAPGDDGSFTATPDEGDPVTVRPATAATTE
ncbi:hypothetical protein [Qipengyuania sp. RANM35]|uniref:hypothetical protein n=1 Tax=Qipengyuania sp. RANM35 TaxID=3068635 RepID=UPI0034DB6E38